MFKKIIPLMLVSILLAACSSTPKADPFIFANTNAGEYTQVDRMGMPAIATAVVTNKDAYNAGTPVDDAALKFAVEIATNVDGIHGALDDDLAKLGLVPCKVDLTDPFNKVTSSCIDQAAPLIVPDTLSIDTKTVAGFPNGRKLTDPVIDVTLAVVLLDLGAPNQTALSLVGALNPKANDKAFTATAPYLAAPHK